MAPKMTSIVATAMLVFAVGASASGVATPRRQLQDSGSCVVTGAAAGSGDCNVDGCCDTFVECSSNGTCDVAEPGCTAGSCSDDEVCAADVECVVPTDVEFVPDLSVSTVVGTIIYEGTEITLMRSSDGNSIVEATVFNDQLGTTVHIEYDIENNRPGFAYMEGAEEGFLLGYDEDGNLVDAVEETGVRRHLAESPSKMSPTDREVTRKLQSSQCISDCDLIFSLRSYYLFCVSSCTGLPPDVCAVWDALCLNVIAQDALRREQCKAACDTSVTNDPHMVGMLGQKIDWSGEDGNWYVIMHDGAEKQIAVRVTAPLPEEFPDRQLVTGMSLVSAGGHSLIIEAVNTYTTETAGCPPDMMAPCLAEGSLRITVDGEQTNSLVSPGEKIELPGGVIVSAANLPAECQPFGGDLEWASTFEEITHGRKLYSANSVSFVDFVKSWTKHTAAPMWCEKFLNEKGTEGENGLFTHSSKHVVFNVESPEFGFRLHHGTNHQGGEIIPDGRVLPELEFWQMNFHLNWADVNYSTVTGILGQTARPVFDKVTGVKIMKGIEALGAEIEDFRLSGPLSTEFAQLSK